MRKRLAAGVLAMVALAVGCGDSSRVLVGAGTTIVDSGLMQQIESGFAGNVSIVGGSTAEILELADKGSFSVAIVHDAAQELEFVAAHPGTERRPVFTSRFLVVGPSELVAAIGAQTPSGVLEEIARNGWTFVTRDDGSGTHVREMALWAEAGVQPTGDWYLATGQGMGFTLQVADQRGGFTIVEEGAFLAAADTVRLEPVVFADESSLVNPYSALLIQESGRAFYEWLTGPDGTAAVLAANSHIFGAIVYSPSNEDH